MTDAYRTYQKAMRNVFGPGWWTTWPLSTRLQVGSVCLVRDGQLLPQHSLHGLGIDVQVGEGQLHDDLTYDSAGSVSITIRGSGATGTSFHALSSGEAGAKLEFAREGSVFAAFSGLRESGVVDPATLAPSLVRLYLRNNWQPEWVAVTHIMTAGHGTVFVAAAAGAEAELRLNAQLGSGPVEVAAVAAAAGVARRHALGLDWLGEDSTPFCRVVRLRDSWWRGIDAEFAPRMPGRGLGPADVPPRLLRRASEHPDEVLEIDAMPDERANQQTVAE